MTEKSKQRILSRIEEFASPVRAEEQGDHPDRRDPTIHVGISKKLEILRENLELNSTDFILLEDRGDLGDTLTRCFERYGVRKAVVFDTEVPGGSELRKIWKEGGKSSPRCEFSFGTGKSPEDSGGVSRFLDDADICVTGCRSIVAEGGICIIDSSSAAGRLSSLLPAHHVVVAERSAIVNRLEDIMGTIRNDLAGRIPLRSSFVFISGPSRTADIEKQLVLGVHGPLSLTVIIMP